MDAQLRYKIVTVDQTRIIGNEDDLSAAQVETKSDPGLGRYKMLKRISRYSSRQAHVSVYVWVVLSWLFGW
jgi:hypothetical protein